MNTVASLPAKLLSLVHEMTVLPAMSLTGSSVILPVLKAAEIVATMRRAAEALASPAPSAGVGVIRSVAEYEAAIRAGSAVEYAEPQRWERLHPDSDIAGCLEIYELRAALQHPAAPSVEDQP